MDDPTHNNFQELVTMFVCLYIIISERTPTKYFIGESVGDIYWRIMSVNILKILSLLK